MPLHLTPRPSLRQHSTIRLIHKSQVKSRGKRAAALPLISGHTRTPTHAISPKMPTTRSQKKPRIDGVGVERPRVSVWPLVSQPSPTKVERIDFLWSREAFNSRKHNLGHHVSPRASRTNTTMRSPVVRGHIQHTLLFFVTAVRAQASDWQHHHRPPCPQWQHRSLHACESLCCAHTFPLRITQPAPTRSRTIGGMRHDPPLPSA